MSVPFLLFLIASLLLVSAWLLQPWWTRRRRARLRETPFPAAWRRILQQRVPLLQRLPTDLQLQLKRHIQVFLAEKPFIGCAGLVIDDGIRLTIAAQACLPLLNRPDAYYPDLRQILVYPGPFVVDRAHTDSTGVLQNMRQVLAGESWSQGQVILSWQDVLADAAHPEAGRNVVIHEFAHQLDQETGAANGAPELHSAQAYARWSQVLGAAFEQLQQRTQQGLAGVLDSYGASNPAEFFAVVSEAFFLQPGALANEHPDLFDELRRFYCIDPLTW
ncbi:MAG: zinc-dependent peptidase [Rhodoferax sp.]|jgi:MtfA peptidase|nr:zinc-dependent peptidase [Rhodoferax sp.]